MCDSGSQSSVISHLPPPHSQTHNPHPRLSHRLFQPPQLKLKTFFLGNLNIHTPVNNASFKHFSNRWLPNPKFPNYNDDVWVAILAQLTSWPKAHLTPYQAFCQNVRSRCNVWSFKGQQFQRNLLYDTAGSNGESKYALVINEKVYQASRQGHLTDIHVDLIFNQAQACVCMHRPSPLPVVTPGWQPSVLFLSINNVNTTAQ